MKLVLIFTILIMLAGCKKNNLNDSHIADNKNLNDTDVTIVLQKENLHDINKPELTVNSTAALVFKLKGSTNLPGKTGIIIKADNLPVGNEARTIKLRVKPEELTGTIISYGKRAKNAQCAISFKPNKTLFFWGWYADLGCRKILPTNEWSSIAVNYDGENICLFVNDEKIANRLLTLDTAETDSLTLGKDFKGEIADVEIFNLIKNPENPEKSEEKENYEKTEKQKVLEILDNL